MTSKGHRAAVYGTCIAAAIVLLLVRYRETLGAVDLAVDMRTPPRVLAPRVRS